MQRGIGAAVVVAVALLTMGLGGGTDAMAGAKARIRKAKRLLAQLSTVDGAGSGLDADTVSGLKPLKLVDANGTFVGALLDLPGNGSAQIIRRLGVASVRMSAGADGFDNQGLDYRFHFESGDCSGTLLMRPNTGRDRLFPPTAIIVGTTARFVTGGVERTVHSAAIAGTSQSDCDLNATGSTFVPPFLCCHGPLLDTVVLGEPTSFDLTTLGLVPPFHLDIPTEISPATTTPASSR